VRRKGVGCKSVSRAKKACNIYLGRLGQSWGKKQPQTYKKNKNRSTPKKKTKE
jgi:hypothetical protein